MFKGSVERADSQDGVKLRPLDEAHRSLSQDSWDEIKRQSTSRRDAAQTSTGAGSAETLDFNTHALYGSQHSGSEVIRTTLGRGSCLPLLSNLNAKPRLSSVTTVILRPIHCSLPLTRGIYKWQKLCKSRCELLLILPVLNLRLVVPA